MTAYNSLAQNFLNFRSHYSAGFTRADYPDICYLLKRKFTIRYMKPVSINKNRAGNKSVGQYTIYRRKKYLLGNIPVICIISKFNHINKTLRKSSQSKPISQKFNLNNEKKEKNNQNGTQFDVYIIYLK
jgi:hypothetical protein